MTCGGLRASLPHETTELDSQCIQLCGMVISSHCVKELVQVGCGLEGSVGFSVCCCCPLVLHNIGLTQPAVVSERWLSPPLWCKVF